jgi:hypothetical protein
MSSESTESTDRVDGRDITRALRVAIRVDRHARNEERMSAVEFQRSERLYNRARMLSSLVNCLESL